MRSFAWRASALHEGGSAAKPRGGKLARGHGGMGYQRGLELGPGLGLGMREAFKVGAAPRAALALNYHSRVAGGG